MSSLEKQLKAIEKKLQSKIQDALAKEVAEVVKERMKFNIKKYVYDAYRPSWTSDEPRTYERRYDSDGGLASDESIDAKVKGNTLIVENIARSNEDYLPDGKSPFKIAGVIEYGHDGGYGEYDYPTNMGFLQPRPFIEETRNDLLQNGQHIEAMKKGLKSRGIKIE